MLRNFEIRPTHKATWNKNHLFRKVIVVFSVALVLVTVTWSGENRVLASSNPKISFEYAPFSSSPPCTTKILWYTKGTQVCAPTSVKGRFKWQTYIKQSDTTPLIRQCRNVFSTREGNLACDWVQKYVNNMLAIRGPKDNCVAYIRGLLQYMALGALSTKAVTFEALVTPYATKNSWTCHP